MSIRQIILDTETTGISVTDGHRIIEIGCLEMIDRKLTGKKFHEYINPLREIDAGAQAVHGITNQFLQDKPTFTMIDQALMDFITGAELIIHNAPFDVSFLNYELSLTQKNWNKITEYCRITDTLLMARQLHVGQRNSLDALCKRYGVDNSKRDMHGALLDAYLLAQVYLAMTGGQGSFFDTLNEAETNTTIKNAISATAMPLEKHQLTVLTATADELAEHEKYLQHLKDKGKCLWLTDEFSK